MRPRPLAVLAAVLASLGATTSAGAASTPALPLSHAGRWLTDAHGRVVVLHGLNEVHKLPPYTPRSTGFGADDAAFLARSGFDVVRVGIIYKGLEPRPGHYAKRYLDAIAATVNALGRRGVVSVLDFHQDMYNERYQGEGFPDWATIDDGLPAVPQAGFPDNYLVQPAVQRAFDNFWADRKGPGGVGLQERYAAAWRYVAKRFADDPHVAGYELLNEPWPGHDWGPCLAAPGCRGFDAKLTAFDRKITRAIRTVDRSTLVLFEPNVLFNGGPATNLGPIRDRHAVFAFHDYCLTQDAPGQAKTCHAADEKVFDHADAWARAHGDGLLSTEFGATDVLPTLRSIVARADRHRTGWVEWAYTGHDPTSQGPDSQSLVLDPAKPPRGANVKTAKLKVLGEPYPQVVAGTPASFGYAPPSGRLTARWSTRRAGGHGRFGRGTVSVVSLPGFSYPRGYAVNASGAAVASARGAGKLVLRTCPGAHAVRLTVTRGAGRLRGGCSVTSTRR